MVAFYFPKLVDLHNYAAANAVRQKVYNWNTLNEKVCLYRLMYRHRLMEVDFHWTECYGRVPEQDRYRTAAG